MFYRGTYKANYGFRVSIIMDADSRFILSYVIGTEKEEKPKRGEKYSELELKAIALAEKTLAEYGVVDEHGQPMKIINPGKSNRCSSFFSALSCEKLLRYDYESYDELKMLVDSYMNYYNNERILSVLGKDCLLPVCFLQDLFGENCKTFLANVASPNWRKLQSFWIPRLSVDHAL